MSSAGHIISSLQSHLLTYLGQAAEPMPFSVNDSSVGYADISLLMKRLISAEKCCWTFGGSGCDMKLGAICNYSQYKPATLLG